MNNYDHELNWLCRSTAFQCQRTLSCGRKPTSHGRTLRWAAASLHGTCITSDVGKCLPGSYLLFYRKWITGRLMSFPSTRAPETMPSSSWSTTWWTAMTSSTGSGYTQLYKANTWGLRLVSWRELRCVGWDDLLMDKNHNQQCIDTMQSAAS